eukprot:SAG22_NODE_105_length_20045_cov_23.373308_9_plen_633_part_00
MAGPVHVLAPTAARIAGAGSTDLLLVGHGPYVLGSVALDAAGDGAAAAADLVPAGLVVVGVAVGRHCDAEAAAAHAKRHGGGQPLLVLCPAAAQPPGPGAAATLVGYDSSGAAVDVKVVDSLQGLGPSTAAAAAAAAVPLAGREPLGEIGLLLFRARLGLQFPAAKLGQLSGRLGGCKVLLGGTMLEAVDPQRSPSCLALLGGGGAGSGGGSGGGVGGGGKRAGRKKGGDGGGGGRQQLQPPKRAGETGAAASIEGAIDLQVLMPVGSGGGDGGGGLPTLNITGTAPPAAVFLGLDVLCYQPALAPAEEEDWAAALQATVLAALQKQLAAMVAMVPAGDAAGKGPALPARLEAFHFRPKPLVFAVTAVYPVVAAAAVAAAEIEPADEPALLGRRSVLHAQLGVPVRPAFRRSCALGRPRLHSRLLNVHEGLGPSGVKGGTRYLVDGDYEYFHYCQDRFDDNGWGCAYRSLQTLCSWCREQHYVVRPPPAHREIQQALVELGDKPPGFVGSKQWIGAVEVGSVLQHLLGVEYKILFVSAGSQLEDKGRELADHFAQHGSPVMMGGGALAYTLLGVDFNAETGEVAFLVLDPHFPDEDDLAWIQRKGWVGWKPGSFFDQASFYNLCRPQRPPVL